MTQHSRLERQVKPTLELPSFLHSRSQAAPDLQAASFGRVLQEFTLRPTDVATVKVAIPPAQMGSNFIVHHLAQVTEGTEIGGYTVILPPLNLLDQHDRMAASCHCS